MVGVYQRTRVHACVRRSLARIGEQVVVVVVELAHLARGGTLVV